MIDDEAALQAPTRTGTAQQVKGTREYFPPSSVILNGLGISLIDLDRLQVTVSGQYLRFLLSKIAGQADFDAVWYERENPDVRAAKIAGEIASYQEHFEWHGYLEGRSPREPPFDPNWYRDTYRDLRASCSTPEAAREHFRQTGFAEGRAGIAEHLADAEQWRLGTLG